MISGGENHKQYSLFFGLTDKDIPRFMIGVEDILQKALSGVEKNFLALFIGYSVFEKILIPVGLIPLKLYRPFKDFHRSHNYCIYCITHCQVRRGWDSDPRSPCGDTCFRNRRTRPLCDLSIISNQYQYKYVVIGYRLSVIGYRLSVISYQYFRYLYR